MSWRPDKYLEELYRNNTIKYRFNAKTKEEWQEWRNGLKKVFIEDLGGFPQNRIDLNPKVIEEKEFDDYIRQRIVYTADENLDVPAYLLIPKGKGGKLPAVIACHGHGYGSRDVVGLSPDDSEKQGDIGYQKNFGIELVKRGMMVIVPEILGFGDRRLEEDANKPLEQSSCHRISTYLLMIGKTIAGLRVYDIIRTIDYLCSRDDVDPEKIGCMGISGGGLVCAFASAIDERIKAVVISGYANTFKDSIMAMFHCVDNFVPGLLKHGEMSDIIGLIAPRPLLIESGKLDNIFPVDTAMKAFYDLENIYNLLGVRENLDIDIFEGPHQISGKKAYDALKKWLG